MRWKVFGVAVRGWLYIIHYTPVLTRCILMTFTIHSKTPHYILQYIPYPSLSYLNTQVQVDGHHRNTGKNPRSLLPLHLDWMKTKTRCVSVLWCVCVRMAWRKGGKSVWTNKNIRNEENEENKRKKFQHQVHHLTFIIRRSSSDVHHPTFIILILDSSPQQIQHETSSSSSSPTRKEKKKDQNKK